MREPPRPEETKTEGAAHQVGATQRPAAESKLPPVADPAASGISPPVPTNTLTPEEQMARFAKELKENDWGHQPC